MSGEHAHPEVGALDAAVATLQTRVEQLAGQVGALEAAHRILEGKVDAMATWHDYSGKPGTTQTVPAGGYVRLDVDVADPPRSGVIELHKLYVNASLRFASGADVGVIRVKYVRENGDETAFADHHVSREAAIGSPGSYLITATHWEIGQAGMGGRWWIRCGGGLTSIALTTRYCSIAQVG